MRDAVRRENGEKKINFLFAYNSSSSFSSSQHEIPWNSPPPVRTKIPSAGGLLDAIKQFPGKEFLNPTNGK